ncbi:MAG: SoxR reducing system RseC family protein [Gammaproteobacteria bacterium]|nr:SoxR reducing system RseC family protein [Gammaproteobacteria bacterium]
MLKEQATVVRVVDRQVELEISRKSACGNCELRQGCGTGAIARLLGHRNKPVVIKSDIDLEAGDRLVLGLPDSGVLGASLLIYGLPLFIMVVASSLSHWITDGSELMTVIAAVAGFLSGFLTSATLATKVFSRQFYPQVLQVNGEPNQQF